MLSRTSVVVFLLSLFFLACSGASTGRGLVLLDSLHLRNTHSQFFQSLEGLYSLEYREASHPKLELSKYGEYLYDILVIFAPAAEEFGGKITLDAILNFVDDGHSMLIAGGHELSDFNREIAKECGVEFEDEGSFVVDHFNFDKSDFDGDHTLLVANNFLPNATIITGTPTAPVLFRGIGHTLEKGNHLLLPILRASPNAYTAADQSDLASTGKGQDLLLISALQARNNARVTFSGSLEFFSDKFFQSGVQTYSLYGKAKAYEKSGNEELSRNLVLWTFGKRGVLRSSNVRHHRVGESSPRPFYTIKEDIEYLVDVEEWDGQKWVPYNGKDIQLEFVMLDPYVRTFLQRDGKTATFKATFKIPDVYGIFTFRLGYSRLGYTTLTEIERVTVRPLRHDQYERFIVSAYPYYASSFSMLLGVFVFSFFFLYNREPEQKKQ